MRRLAYLVLAALILQGSAGGMALNAQGHRLMRDFIGRPLGPLAPLSPPQYLTYLPVTMNRYLAGYVTPFGIDMYAGDTDADGRLQMRAAGSGWVTVTFDWSAVEPNAPVSGVHTYDWSSFDATVALAKAASSSVFVLFTNNPAWAADLRGGPVYTSTVQDLNSLAAAAAERYDGDGLADAPGSPVVNYWSFYAEPDNGDLGRAQTSGKGYWGNNPSGYADMIAGVSTAMHVANPNAVVMIGGLAYDYFDTFNPPGPFVQSFLGRVLDALNQNWGGAAKYLGAMAFHYYPISPGLWPTIKEKTLEIRSILTAHGVGNLPLIVPEMGYWSDVVLGNPAFDSSEPQQARTLVQMFVRGLSVGIQQMSWFMVFDSGAGTEAHGLFRGTDLNSPKPAYTAYATLTAELFGARYFSPLSGAGVEGYVFDMGGGQYKTVVWATQASAQVTFQQSCLRRVDYMGTITTPILDGDPAWDQDAVAGQITLQVLQDQPIYVGGC